MKNYYKSGSWNVICQLCGKKMKSSDVHKRWDGLLVCEDDYENRNILDFIRTHPEKLNVPYLNPEVPDQFAPEVCTVPGRTARTGKGVAGCMIAGLIVGDE